MLEVAPHDVGEIFDIDLDIRIEGIEIVDRDQTRRHVPLVIASLFVFLLEVRLDLVVGAEHPDIGLRVLVAD